MILNALPDAPRGLSLSEIAEKTGLHVSTAQRMLRTLEKAGFIRRDQETRRYRVGFRVYEIARRSASTLLEAALPAMRSLSQATGEMCSLAALEGPDIIFLERVQGSHQLQLAGRIGYRAPAYCTSMGKALLAFTPKTELDQILRQTKFKRFTRKTITSIRELEADLDRTRQRQFAIVEEEYDEGVRAVAVPLLDAANRPIAALCLTYPSNRHHSTEAKKFAALLSKARAQIESSLL